MDRNDFFAKSCNQNGIQKTVKEHLTEVAAKAKEYGDEIGWGTEAELCGMLHDFGKYSDAFQGVLKGTQQNRDHAICGAALLNMVKGERKSYDPIIEVINAHHSALLEYEMLESLCQASTQNEDAIEANEGKIAALAGEKQYMTAWARLQHDFQGWKIPKLKQFHAALSDTGTEDAATYQSNVQTMLYTRMLFSCLVDADYTVSAADDNLAYLEKSEVTEFEPEQMLEQLYQYRESIRKHSDANAKVNAWRDQLFEQCGKMGEMPEGLFTLTAPTGTGKTLALLHFALRHCAATGKKRIMIVLPFLTLTEQNADVYRHVVPELLEDHSQSDLDDVSREFSARWRVPVIITTSVRFFETLFAHKPTDCRKLHNIANSVVVFDEAQSLPAELTTASLQAVHELCRSYHTTMVFSTATQPNFDALQHVTWKPTEILPEHAVLYQALKRTQVEWRIEHDEKTSLEMIAQEMAEQKSVCTIVNLRKHARTLYEILKEQCREEEVFFLTTDLCTAHRRELVAEINNRLENQQPCRVVATQCIEAGVDFDFEVLYRALAPLESIIQAAGRCNRNGRLPEGGRVIVFIPEEEEPLYPGNWYEAAAHIVENLHQKHAIDIHNPEHIREYYAALFREAKDKKQLTAAIQNRSFSETDKEYQLIANQGIRVIVPYQKMQEDYRDICTQVRQYGLTPALIKKAAPITVTVGISQKNKLEDIAEELFYCKQGRKTETKSDFYILFPQNEDFYTEDMGLQLPEQVEFQACW